MSIQFKNGMTVDDINEQLEKRVNNSSSDSEIKNLYKKFNKYPFNFQEGQPPITTDGIICNFSDLRKFYVEWEEYINGKDDT